MWHYKIHADNHPILNSINIPGLRPFSSGIIATLAAEAVCEALGVPMDTLEITVYSIEDTQTDLKAEYIRYIQDCNENSLKAMSYAEFCEPEVATV